MISRTTRFSFTDQSLSRDAIYTTVSKKLTDYGVYTQTVESVDIETSPYINFDGDVTNWKVEVAVKHEDDDLEYLFAAGDPIEGLGNEYPPSGALLTPDSWQAAVENPEFASALSTSQRFTAWMAGRKDGAL